MDSDRPRGSHSTRRVLIAGAVVGVLLLGGLAVGSRSRPDGASAAMRLLADEGAFDTTRNASDSFAHVSELLQAEGDRCSRERSAETHPCAGQLQGSAWAQVTAFAATRCTQTRIAEARVALFEYLDALSAPGAADDPPRIPALPRC